MCGNRHKPMDQDSCRSIGTGETIATKSSTKMPTTKTKESVSELKVSGSALSLEERRERLCWRSRN